MPAEEGLLLCTAALLAVEEGCSIQQQPFLWGVKDVGIEIVISLRKPLSCDSMYLRSLKGISTFSFLLIKMPLTLTCQLSQHRV